MKIAAVVAQSGVDFGLNAAYKIAVETLKETGEDVKVFNLAPMMLDFYDASNATVVSEMMDGIDTADGVIFAFNASYATPNAMLLTFLEYFADIAYRTRLEGKPCLLMCISQCGIERVSLESLAGIVAQLGGIDVVRIALNSTVASIATQNSIDLIERQTEDFYRILRQGRRYVLPQKHNAPVADQSDALTANPINISDIYKKHNLETITNEQEEDIEKISAMFAKKFTANGDDSIAEQSAVSIVQNKENAGRSPKQLTANLEHRFNPHLAKEVQATFQLNITGPGGFDAYIAITPSSCIFNEGEAPTSDILITADTQAWNDILTKKITAQKAFMMGQVKVRGNFVLLTKFDQIFNA